jgi:hypothetical protein
VSSTLDIEMPILPSSLLKEESVITAFAPELRADNAGMSGDSETGRRRGK